LHPSKVRLLHIQRIRVEHLSTLKQCAFPDTHSYQPYKRNTEVKGQLFCKLSFTDTCRTDKKKGGNGFFIFIESALDLFIACTTVSIALSWPNIVDFNFTSRFLSFEISSWIHSVSVFWQLQTPCALCPCFLW